MHQFLTGTVGKKYLRSELAISLEHPIRNLDFEGTKRAHAGTTGMGWNLNGDKQPGRVFHPLDSHHVRTFGIEARGNE